LSCSRKKPVRIQAHASATREGRRRMKDFYDIWMLSRASEFNDDRLARSNAATFARRNTSARVSLRERFRKAQRRTVKPS
jgi:hypothetical protein